MRIIFCAYRDWAINVLPTIDRHPRVSFVKHITNNDDFYKELHSYIKYDFVLFCGWSTPPDEHTVKNSIPMFSEHPAFSDRYSPGTPLQNQILDGWNKTKHRIVKVGFPELSPRQWSHEVDMSLLGNMDEILFQMEATSRQLFNMFLTDYPNVTWKTWDEVPQNEQMSRRVPEQSKITKEEFANLTTRELYDKIRCLESPYPNAYIEDDRGVLYFERVKFKVKK